MRKLFTILFSSLCLLSFGQRQVLGIDKNNAMSLTPKLFIQDGNSIGKGETTSIGNGEDIGALIDATLNSHWDYFNTSISGRSTGTMTVDLPTYVYPKFSGADYTKIIVASVEGTNDIHGNGNGYTSYWNMVTYINTLLNEDDRIHVMIYMCINGTPTYLSDTARRSFNDLLAAMPETNRFKVVDFRSDSLLNGFQAYLNTTYYNVDGVHLTATGYALLASYGQTVFNRFGFEGLFVVLLLAGGLTWVEKKLKIAA